MTWDMLLPLDMLFGLLEEFLSADLPPRLLPGELLLFLDSDFTSIPLIPSLDKLLLLEPLLRLPLAEELSLLLLIQDNEE